MFIFSEVIDVSNVYIVASMANIKINIYTLYSKYNAAISSFLMKSYV